MPEELPAENGGAPEATQTQDQPETTDWQKRYTDTHADWNRLNEEITHLRSDPQALVKFLQEHHPDLLEEDEPDEEPDLEPDEEDRPLTRAEFNAWKAEQAQAETSRTQAQQFEADYKAVLNDREISKHGDRAIRYALNQGEIKNPDDLKKAVDEWFEEHGATAKPKPRVPHTVTNGTAATQQPDWSKMTPGEINRFMAEQVTAQAAQT